MNRISSRIPSIAFALTPCVIVCFALLQAGCVAQESTAKGPAPQWELKGVDGQTMKLSDFTGKIVILDFWATWCGPCRLEIPHFVELQKEYGSQGLVVIGVSLDEQGPPVVRKFMESFNVNYPMAMADQKVVEDYGGVSAIPTTFVIDRQGNFVAKFVGYSSKEEFKKIIKPLL